jgi:hypothetical protein
MEKPNGNFLSDGEIDRLQREVGKLLSPGREGPDTNLRGLGWRAEKKLWEFLDGRLTPEQLFAIERILVTRLGGPAAIRRLNIQDGRINFVGWRSPVNLDHFVEALRQVTAPFAESDEVPAAFAASGR